MNKDGYLWMRFSFYYMENKMQKGWNSSKLFKLIGLNYAVQLPRILP